MKYAYASIVLLALAVGCKKKNEPAPAPAVSPASQRVAEDAGLAVAVPRDAGQSAAQPAPDAGAATICSQLGLDPLQLRREIDLIDVMTAEGLVMGTYTAGIESDLNGDGHAEIVLELTDGCSRSGGCMNYVFLNCGNGNYGQLADLGYAKVLEVDAQRRNTKGWLDLWLLAGDRDDDRPACYIETRTRVRWTGQTYEQTSETTTKRTCERR